MVAGKDKEGPGKVKDGQNMYSLFAQAFSTYSPFAQAFSPLKEKRVCYEIRNRFGKNGEQNTASDHVPGLVQLVQNVS